MSNAVSGYTADDVERAVSEPVKRLQRSPFARDRARVLHSAGLRRLAAKTQVRSAGEADFPRTRLTHTLEVAQIAREIGASLGCDPDLVDVAGLAHDLGHPPFGHNGEDALNVIAAGIGGFEGNAQSFRVLTRLEAKVTEPATGASAGLNLTRAALDAVCKYPWLRRSDSRKFNAYANDAVAFTWARAGAPAERRCLEAQVMDWADDVAYSVHDVEDAIHSGHVDVRIFASPTDRDDVVAAARRYYAPHTDVADLEQAWARLVSLPWWMARYDGSLADLAALKHLASELIGRFCAAVEVATRVTFGDGQLTRYSADLLVPDEVRAEVAVLKAVAMHFVMQRPGAEALYERQREVIDEVTAAVIRSDGHYLEPWLAGAFTAADDDAQRLRVVVDQIASLTDVSIMDWHARLVK